MLYELDDVCKTLGDKQLIKDFTTRILQKILLQLLDQMDGKSTLKISWKK